MIIYEDRGERMTALLVIFQNIGSVVGVCVTIITCFGLISKKPRAALKRMIKEGAEEANKEVNTKLTIIEEKLKESDETDVVMLRHSITDLYHQYKDTKKIPHYAKEDWMGMLEKYEQKGGNCYIHAITEEMKEWEEI